MCNKHRNKEREDTPGVGKCPNVSHHPTTGDINSNKYFQVMWNKSPTIGTSIPTPVLSSLKKKHGLKIAIADYRDESSRIPTIIPARLTPANSPAWPINNEIFIFGPYALGLGLSYMFFFYRFFGITCHKTLGKMMKLMWISKSNASHPKLATQIERLHPTKYISILV